MDESNVSDFSLYLPFNHGVVPNVLLKRLDKPAKSEKYAVPPGFVRRLNYHQQIVLECSLKERKRQITKELTAIHNAAYIKQMTTIKSAGQLPYFLQPRKTEIKLDFQR